MKTMGYKFGAEKPISETLQDLITTVCTTDRELPTEWKEGIIVPTICV